MASDFHENGNIEIQNWPDERHQKTPAEKYKGHQAEHSYRVVDLAYILGEKVAQYVAAIERRNRNEVKHGEQNVNLEKCEEEQARRYQRGVAQGIAAQGAANNQTATWGSQRNCRQENGRAGSDDEVADRACY